MQTRGSRLLTLAAGALVLGALGTAGAQTQSTALTGEELLPPGAKPGECYARVFVPPVYKTETLRVVKREASERLEIIPARYEWVEENVMVKGPSEKLEVIPATFEWVDERILVQPASMQEEEIPPIYETVTEQVLDRPAHTIWKKGTGSFQRIDHATGEIMCLVEVPATYKTVTKRVLKHPATTRTMKLPAKYKTLKKRVMKTPPTTRVVKIPAEYRTVKVRKLVSKSQTKHIPIPAQYQTVTKKNKMAEGRMEWQPVLCQTNATPQTVKDIQRALLKAGHNPGPIDGVIGSDTMRAVESYQRTKGLPVGRLTIETLRSLGVLAQSAALQQ
jgi:hypothetical protein